MMPRCLLFLCFTVSAVASRNVAAAPGDLLFKLTALDRDRRTSFGESLAIVDGDIVVGELYRFDPLSGPGRAYLFDGKTGQFRLTFSNPEREDQDHFAVALAGGNGTVFISTSGLPSRVYGFSSSTGELLRTFQEPTGMTLGLFGTSLAYGNDTLFVGDPSYSVDLSTVGTGRAYLFDTTTGELARTILNPEPNRGDLFGSVRSLALFGDKLAVGAIGDNALKGRVWVFDRSSGEVAFALDNPHPEGAPGPPFSGDWFGQTVAANDEIIAVGAELEDAGGVDNAGIVYIFDSNTGALRHTLISPQLEVDGDFGRSLTLTPDGDILVGAWATNVNGIESAGHAYLFDDITGDLLLDLTSPEPVIGGAFGWSVAAIEGALIVSAPSDGAVYVFEAIPEPSTLVLAGSLLLTILAIRRFVTVKQ